MIDQRKIGNMIAEDWELLHRCYLYGYWHGAYHKDQTWVLESYYPGHLCWKAYFQGMTDGLGDKERKNA